MTSPPAAPDDATLVQAARAGENRAFTELMRRHKEPLYRLIRIYVGDTDEAYDLAQETFLAAWAALERFDTARPFAIWLKRIAINKCRDWIRRRRVRRFFYGAESIDARHARDIAVQPLSDESSADEGLLTRLDAAITALPPALKEPLLLTLFDGLSHKEAGQILGVSAKAVETRVYRARQALSRALGETS